MRFAVTHAAIVVATLAGPACAASAQTPAGPAAGDPGQHYDVPDGSKPQTVVIIRRDFAAGQSTGRHIHHGVEMTYVAQGDIQVEADGLPTHVYHAGDSIMVPREVVHNATNIGKTAAVIYVTYVIDKGTPLRESVP